MQISGIYRCLKHRCGGVTFTSPEPVWKQGLFLISYSSFLGSAAADAALCSAAAPLLWLLLSWLSMRACSFFTSSSSSACTPETRRREGSDTSVDGWRGAEGLQTETKHKKVCACVCSELVVKPLLGGDLGPQDHTGKSEIGWSDISATLMFCNSHVLFAAVAHRRQQPLYLCSGFHDISTISFSVFTHLARKWPWTIDFLETPKIIMRFQ